VNPVSWLASLDKDVTIALIGLFGALVGGLATGLFNAIASHRPNLAHAYNELAAAQSEMQREIDAQDRKLRKLFDDNERLRAESHEFEDRDVERTRYLRELFHWLDGLCESGEVAWTKSHPKPHLPESMRPDFPKLH
jgi:hypothetical protein